MAVGALSDGTPVIVTGGDGTVRLWRLAGGTRSQPALYLSKQVRGVAFDGNVIVTAAGPDIAVHEPVLSRPVR